ncbi:hypothetical protein ONZ45_g12913 [Pleurotus djamor]|nr:hypothetical protein ONZ45_g12913 [Pleurotus djamor]
MSQDPPEATEPLYHGFLRGQGPLIRSLELSVRQYHVFDLKRFDPVTDYCNNLDDQGYIPHQSTNYTDVLRNVLLRWTSPQCNNYWHCLADDWDNILDHPIDEDKDIIAVPGLHPPLFSLSYSLLEVYGHVFMAINQILHGLSELAGLPADRAHRFDPGYQVTRLLDCGGTRAEVTITFSLLKGRARSSCEYILARLQRIQRGLRNPSDADEDDRESLTLSYDSSVSALRTRYGTRSPRTERARMLYNPRYQQYIPPHLNQEAEEMATYYRPEPDGFDPLAPKPWKRTLPWYREERQMPRDPLRKLVSKNKKKLFPPSLIPLATCQVEKLLHTYHTGASQILDEARPLKEVIAATRPLLLLSPNLPRNRLASTLPLATTLLVEILPSLLVEILPILLVEILPILLVEIPLILLEEGERRQTELHLLLIAAALLLLLDKILQWPLFLRNLRRVEIFGSSIISLLPLCFGSLLHLGDYTPVDLARLAPVQFTDAALDWFNALTSADRDYMTGSWDNFCEMLRDQFMGQAWINARTMEFEETKFRQPKHADETPLHFLQRRLKLANILYEAESDGVLVSRVLRTQPEAWTPHLNPTSCPTVRILLAQATELEHSLLAAYKANLNQTRLDSLLNNLSNRSRPFSYRRNNSANAADVYDESDIANLFATDGSDSPAANEVAAASTKLRPSSRNLSSRDWPKGRTIKGYTFTRDDTVISDKRPRNGCFLCMSMLHFHRECPHFKRWEAMKEVLLADGMINPESFQAAEVEYDACTGEVANAEMKPLNSSSTELSNSGTSEELSSVIPINKRPASATSRVCPSNLKALHMYISLNSPTAPTTQARLDSGADITLISEELWDSLTPRPPLREDKVISLYQLTGSAEVRGRVRLTLYVPTDTGETLSFSTLAFVVKGMRVPLLLGEDFQTDYEFNIFRSASGLHTVMPGYSKYRISAYAFDSEKLGFRIRKACSVQSFVRRKSQARLRSLRRKVAEDDLPTATAAKDIRISPGCYYDVPLDVPMEDPSATWILEKLVIAEEDEASYLVSPTTLVSARKPCLPIANPSTRAIMIRKGEPLGLLHDPEKYCDRPKDLATLRKFSNAAQVMKVAIETARVAHDSPSPPPDTDENWGPKTSAVPEDPSSKNVLEAVHLGPDIPADVRPRLEEVLQRNSQAFGLGGRLGKVDKSMSIPLEAGVQPISLPVYGTSPARKEVIDEQLQKWFEAEVIEPSVSPWGFPCLVIYRNNKPRLVIDYRKLNAKTIADEYPIPRQAEIIQALSGAQVISSFDALAGFTQIEVDEASRPLTAFRCHRGLFQFKRMPFGLRNGPSIFQRLMQEILAPFLWIFALVYIDDIVIYSRSWDDHLLHLDKVLSAIATAGLTLAPSKCYIGWSSILLLGQKVSRLGLSTWKEKVQTVLQYPRPRNTHELQRFLGMVVYFSSYIPHYSHIASPLFLLLRKNIKWNWTAEQEVAFQQARSALSQTPVLGHPVQHSPYRLYTDASDYALGSSLQQVQQIALRDLRNTNAYKVMRKAYEEGEAIPSLITKFPSGHQEMEPPQSEWSPAFDDTVVLVERVIAYWSRTLKPAEKNYSATEREALAAKEALVRFQPFIEGEKITLITDHSALQWARSFEHSNRRLAAWGAVFAAYPELKIIHRAGRVHSNVDPLSRIPSTTQDDFSQYSRLTVPPTPPNDSPVEDSTPPIVPSEESQLKATELESLRIPAERAAFSACWMDEAIDRDGFAVETRAMKRVNEITLNPATKERGIREERLREDLAKLSPVSEPISEPDSWTYPLGVTPPLSLEELERARPALLVSLRSDELESWRKAYEADYYFKGRVKTAREERLHPELLLTPARFQLSSLGLLYFLNADWEHKLCVPRSKVADILALVHESPEESAHAGARRFALRLKEHYYWPTLVKDATEFARSCDVCQKIKVDRRGPMGGLRPAHIPLRPYETVSMDLITGLPPSGEEKFSAVLVIVDKLTKYALFTPTYDSLDQVGFAKLFIAKVINVFGLPSRIICDRDKRWMSGFWKTIMNRYNSRLAVSSAHHPQTDGQTENLNATIEMMLRGYVQDDRARWAEYLSDLQFAYNSAVHGSTSYRPDFLLFGYKPSQSLSSLLPASDGVDRPFLPSQLAEDYITDMELHRQSARDRLVEALERQVRAYNAGRRPVDELKPGEWALVNPHSLQLIEAQGTGRKLIQKTIGPFEVLEKVNPQVYRLRLPENYPMHPVFNFSHLKKYHPSDPRFGTRSRLPPTRSDIPEKEEWEVQAILGHRLSSRKTGRQRMFLLRNAPELKRDYLASLTPNTRWDEKIYIPG